LGGRDAAHHDSCPFQDRQRSVRSLLPGPGEGTRRVGAPLCIAFGAPCRRHAEIIAVPPGLLIERLWRLALVAEPCVPTA